MVESMGRLLIKPGVVLGSSLTPAGARILDTLKRNVRAYGFDVTITSARDGTHSGPNDPHVLGEAFDLRTHGLSTAQKTLLLSDLKSDLYRGAMPHFFAFLEAPNTPNEHIHCQRRAGTTYTMLDYLNDN